MLASIKGACYQMIRNSGMTRGEISTRLDRNAHYVDNALRNTVTIRSDTLVNMADVCGYDIIARQRSNGDEILIEPPNGNGTLGSGTPPKVPEDLIG